ncbi:MAG: ATP-binding cassette domain-containing protein, partial [Bacteroidales bacterium]|nr:ATP-binding cassette domain-containing protein [Bacteroidales bacterium]
RADIRSRTRAALEELGLEDVKDKPIKSLPPGWKQKLAFSIAMLHRPAIIFLDEPTGGVDPITRRQFWNMIYQAADQGVTIFITTHYMDEAEYCHRISIMVDGRIEALDTPQNLKIKYEAADMNEVFLKLARKAD